MLVIIVLMTWLKRNGKLVFLIEFKSIFENESLFYFEFSLICDLYFFAGASGTQSDRVFSEKKIFMFLHFCIFPLENICISSTHFIWIN